MEICHKNRQEKAISEEPGISDVPGIPASSPSSLWYGEEEGEQ